MVQSVYFVYTGNVHHKYGAISIYVWFILKVYSDRMGPCGTLCYAFKFVVKIVNLHANGRFYKRFIINFEYFRMFCFESVQL